MSCGCGGKTGNAVLDAVLAGCAFPCEQAPVLGGRATVVRRVMYRGDTLVFAGAVYTDPVSRAVFTVPVEQLPPPNAVPVDLTGARVWFTAKRAVADADGAAVIRLDNQALGGVTVTSAVGGQFVVRSMPISTVNYPDTETEMVFDVQVLDAAGRVSTAERGTLSLLADVTRATT